jgi:hypothetical protein
MLLPVQGVIFKEVTTEISLYSLSECNLVLWCLSVHLWWFFSGLTADFDEFLYFSSAKIIDKLWTAIIDRNVYCTNTVQFDNSGMEVEIWLLEDVCEQLWTLYLEHFSVEIVVYFIAC